MKKITMLFLLGIALGSQALYAAEKSNGALTFWEKLRVKIESMTPQKKTGATTAAGGVRGVPASTEDVYWKNEATGQTIAADELEAFKKAMKLAELDDKAQAQAAFSEFIRKYSGSSLRKDADEALALLANAGKPAR
jgi:TolA-binding protein